MINSEDGRQNLDWEWDPDDQRHAPKFTADEALQVGLPQGLIASGFFANAYMVGFDRLLSSKINADNSNGEFVIRDYCRYVDDIRLVVEARWQEDTGHLESRVKELVSDVLKKHCDSIGAESASLLLNGSVKIGCHPLQIHFSPESRQP